VIEPPKWLTPQAALVLTFIVFGLWLLSLWAQSALEEALR